MLDEEKIKIIIHDKYIELVSMVLESLKHAPPQPVADDAQMFSNLWGSFMYHVRTEEEDTLENTWAEECINTVVDLCEQAINTLTPTELHLLWMVSDGCMEWDEEDDFPGAEQLIEEVTDELFSWVEQEAEDPELDDEDEDEDEDEDGEGYPAGDLPTRH